MINRLSLRLGLLSVTIGPPWQPLALKESIHPAGWLQVEELVVLLIDLARAIQISKYNQDIIFRSMK